MKAAGLGLEGSTKTFITMALAGTDPQSNGINHLHRKHPKRFPLDENYP